MKPRFVTYFNKFTGKDVEDVCYTEQALTDARARAADVGAKLIITIYRPGRKSNSRQSCPRRAMASAR